MPTTDAPSDPPETNEERLAREGASLARIFRDAATAAHAPVAPPPPAAPAAVWTPPRDTTPRPDPLAHSARLDRLEAALGRVEALLARIAGTADEVHDLAREVLERLDTQAGIKDHD